MLPALIWSFRSSRRAAVWAAYHSCSSCLGSYLQTAELRLPYLSLAFSSWHLPGCHNRVALPRGGFLIAWHTQRSSCLTAAARHCNGLRSLVLSNKSRWKSRCSRYLQCQWEHRNQREALFFHEASLENWPNFGRMKLVQPAPKRLV